MSTHEDGMDAARDMHALAVGAQKASKTPRKFSLDQLHALERAIATQESLALRIELANPDDPYASLIVREDIEVLRDLHVALAAEIASAPAPGDAA